MLLSELLSDFIFKEDSPAADQATQMGLVYKGFGRWADPRSNKVTHKTDGGRLTKVDPAQTKLALDDPEVEKDPPWVQRKKDPLPSKSDPRVTKDKLPRAGAPGEPGFKEKRFAQRQHTKTAVKDIHSQIFNHDWTHDYSDDPSVVKRGAQEKTELLDTIAKSGFTYSQTKSIFRAAGMKRTKHGTSVAGETFTTDDWKDVLHKRIAITKRVQRGVKGEKPVPSAPTKWDDEKYDSGFYGPPGGAGQGDSGGAPPGKVRMIPGKKDRIASQPGGHASDVAALAYAKTGDEELATLSRQLSPEDRGDLEKWLDREDLDDMPDFKQMAKDDPEAMERYRERDPQDRDRAGSWSGVDTSYRSKHKVPKDKKSKPAHPASPRPGGYSGNPEDYGLGNPAKGIPADADVRSKQRWKERQKKQKGWKKSSTSGEWQ